MPEIRRATLERRSCKDRRRIFILHVSFIGNLKDGRPYIIEGRRKKDVMAG